MDEITDQNQPVNHPASLTCRSCSRAGRRVAAGKTTRAGAGLVTHRGFGPACSAACWGPGGPAVPALFAGAAGGLLAARRPGLSETPAVAC
jgi:hypothetical protein